jgi:hypothetical protein
MSQVGRNLTDAVDGILSGKRYLIHDRDPLFTAEFVQILGSSGIKSVKLLFGENSLQRSVHEFLSHYHRERHHQGLCNRLIIPDSSPATDQGPIGRRQRLGGMLNYYYRQAA